MLLWITHRSLDHLLPTLCGCECNIDAVFCTEIAKAFHQGGNFAVTLIFCASGSVYKLYNSHSTPLI